MLNIDLLLRKTEMKKFKKMSKKKDTPYYIGLGIVIIIFGYFAVTNVIHYVKKDKVVDSNRSEHRMPVADKFLKKFNKPERKEKYNKEKKLLTRFCIWSS